MMQEQNNKRSSPTEDPETSQPNKRPAPETLVRYRFLVEQVGICVIPLEGADEHHEVHSNPYNYTKEQIEDDKYPDYIQTFSTNGEYPMVRDLIEQYDLQIGDCAGMEFIEYALEKKLQFGDHHKELAAVFCKAVCCDASQVHHLAFLDNDGLEGPYDFYLEIVVPKSFCLGWEEHTLGSLLARSVRKFFQTTEMHREEGQDPYCPDMYADYKFDFRSGGLEELSCCVL